MIAMKLLFMYQFGVLFCASLQLVTTSNVECAHLRLHALGLNSSTSMATENLFLNCTASEHTCPPWHYCNSNGICNCGNTLDDVINCSYRSLSVLNCFCVTYNSNTLTSELGQCLYNCQHKRHGSEDRIYRSLPQNNTELNEAMCGKFNRRGSLCGSCKDGYYPLAYSYNMTCVRCENTWYNWVEYLVVVYLPLTVFFFIILFFQVNMTSSHLFGFLLYCQAVSFPMMCRVLVLSYHSNRYYRLGIEIAISFYGLWNLDFFRIVNHSTCLASHFLVVTTLDLFSGIYPLVLVFVTYIVKQLYDADYRLLRVVMLPVRLLRSKFGTTFDIKTSLIDVFSTFFLLSNMKLFNASYDLLAATWVYFLEPTGEISSSVRLYLNGSETFFGASHVPFGLLAITVIMIFHLVPSVCLFLYPFRITHKVLAFFSPRCLILLKTFIDPLHSLFTDGTERGTTDFRWFSGVLFASKFLMLIFYLLSFDVMYFVFALIAVGVLTMSITALQPFLEDTHHNSLTPSFLLYLSCVYLCLVAGDTSVIRSPQLVPFIRVLGVVMGFIPLLYAIFLIFRWGVSKKCRIMAA